MKEESRDLKDAELRERVWTGTIPYLEILGTPRVAETCRVKGGVPSYVGDFVRGFNEGVLEWAREKNRGESAVGLVPKSVLSSAVFGLGGILLVLYGLKLRRG